MIVIPRKKDKTVDEEVEKKSRKTYKERFAEIFGDGNLRSDKRKLLTHRPVYMKSGVISDARGSAYVEMGRTKIICSIDGPREIPNIQEYTEEGLLEVEFKFAPFSCKARREQEDEAEEKFLSYRLQSILEAVVCRHEFPNFQVIVTINVLENDGSCLAAAVTASSIALADACLPMFDLANAVTIGVHGDTFITDLSLEEEIFCRDVIPESSEVKDRGVITFTYLPSLDQMSDLYLVGEMDPEKIPKMLELAVQNCQALFQLQHAGVLKKIKQSHFRKPPSRESSEKGDD